MRRRPWRHLREISPIVSRDVISAAMVASATAAIQAMLSARQPLPDNPPPVRAIRITAMPRYHSRPGHGSRDGDIDAKFDFDPSGARRCLDDRARQGADL